MGDKEEIKSAAIKSAAIMSTLPGNDAEQLSKCEWAISTMQAQLTGWGATMQAQVESLQEHCTKLETKINTNQLFIDELFSLRADKQDGQACVFSFLFQRFPTKLKEEEEKEEEEEEEELRGTGIGRGGGRGGGEEDEDERGGGGGGGRRTRRRGGGRKTQGDGKPRKT